jgi:cytochrome c biogenesis protein CcmG/thiol:disulfide interchange protein DsbE
MQKKSFPLVLFAVLVVLLGIGLTKDPRLVPSPLIDKAMPAFSLPRLHEADRTLGSTDLRGQVFLLNVWASWCVACRAEHPILLELAKSGQVTIYGLNYKDQREDALRWLDFYGDPYTTSAYDLEGKVGIDFGVYGVPETFIVDQNGIIRYKQIGPITEEVLNKKIIPFINQLKAGNT